MMNIIRIIIIAFIVLCLEPLYGQEIKRNFTFDDFIRQVKEYHPIARQAQISIEKGDAQLRSSRGGFDPKAFTNIGQKYFQNDQYYSIIDAGLKVPTWFGIELYGGLEQNNGINLNPERKTPNAGLVYAGLAIPIGQGLFIDQRRADLRQAQLFQNISQEEQRIKLNKLLFDAAKAYWDWFASYEIVSVYDDAVRFAEERFEGVRSNALLGDVPIIDTVEAFIQLQNRRIKLKDAELDFFNQTERISVFLWGENYVPLEIEEGVVPVNNENIKRFILDEVIENEIDSLIQNHPALIQGQLTLDQLDIERRWKAEQLKPTFNIKYNALNEALTQDFVAGYSINNYNWGLEFSMPLFLRKERGELKLTKLKMEDQQLYLQHQEQSLDMLVRTSINTWKTTTSQVQLFQENVNNMAQLLEAEKRKFDYGESSLFLVNAREQSYISGQIELAKRLSENQKALLSINYQLGLLGEIE